MAKPLPGEDSVVSLIVRTARVLNEQMRRTRSDALKPLSSVHTVALFYIYSHDSVTVTDLGRHLNVTKQSASDAVSVLEANGIVRRVLHPSDRRARELVLTEKGRAMIRQGQARWARLEHHLIEVVGSDRAEVVRDALSEFLADASAETAG
jgi:DNA-binding MarR family transcriptional regulator